MSELHAVFGAGGGAGKALVRMLVAQGKQVRAVTRSGQAAVPPGVENVRADAADPGAALRASKGARVIYHCVNVPYAEWEDTLPAVLESLIQAAGSEGATLVYCDNLYMYGQVRGPMTETTAEAATSGKGKLRGRMAGQLLEAHAAGGNRLMRGRAPFGAQELRVG
jgi:nucleoside-diphosphate-sugar epimerase